MGAISPFDDQIPWIAFPVRRTITYRGALPLGRRTVRYRVALSLARRATRIPWKSGPSRAASETRQDCGLQPQWSSLLLLLLVRRLSQEMPDWCRDEEGLPAPFDR